MPDNIVIGICNLFGKEIHNGSKVKIINNPTTSNAIFDGSSIDNTDGGSIKLLFIGSNATTYLNAYLIVGDLKNTQPIMMKKKVRGIDIIFGIITIALLLYLFIKTKNYHSDLITNGLIVLAIVGMIFVANYYFSYRNMIITQSLDYSNEDKLYF